MSPVRRRGPAVQAEPARLVADVQGRGLGVVQCVGRRQHGGRVDGHVLGEAARGERGGGQDARAHLALRPLAEGDDLTAQFDARGERQRRPHLVVTAAQQGVREVDVDGPDPQQQFPGPGHRIRHVVEAHHLTRLAIVVHSPCLHPVASKSLR